VFDHSDRRIDSFQRSEFRYDHERDLYICPGGKEMHRHRRATVRAVTSPLDKLALFSTQPGAPAAEARCAPLSGSPTSSGLRGQRIGLHAPGI
jgi:hypothetical protein